MAKKHLLPAENEDFLDRLGLTERDKSVYISILDSGLVSAGEVQQLTRIEDILQIVESIRDLTDIGLVKKAQGMMPRYYATLPFFRETLSVEQDFKFSMEAMLQSLAQAKEKTIEHRERITQIQFPSLVDNLLDQYYQGLLSPILSELEGLKEEVSTNVIDFVKQIDQENAGIKDEINLMITPLVNYANLMQQKFDLGLTSETGELSQYISNKKKQRIDTLKQTHTQLGDSITQLKQTGKGVIAQITAMETQIDQFSDKIRTQHQNITTESLVLTTQREKIEALKNDLTAEILVARQQMRKLIEPKENGSISVSQEDVDRIFDLFSTKIEGIEIDTKELNQSLDNIENMMGESEGEIKELNQNLGKSKIAFNEEFSSNIQTIGDRISSTLNELNDKDEEELMQFKSQMIEKLEALNQAVNEEGKEVRKKIEQHIEDIKRTQNMIFEKWKEKMTEFHNRPVKIISPFLDQWIDTIEPIINQFKQDADGALDDILEPIHKLENETFATLTERISFVKAMVEARTADLQSILEYAKTFDYTKTSDTWIVTGLPSIYASLTDLLMRTKVNVTVVTPNLDLELFEIAKNLKSNIRVTFVADIDQERDARLIKKMEEIGRIQLRDYKKRDLYACMRDNEEMIMGYIQEGEEAVGIRASTPSVVTLLQDRLNETVIRDSKQI